MRALADGDPATACSLMSASTKKNLEVFLEGAAAKSVKNSCTELVEELRSQIEAKRLPPSRVEVTGARIEDDRGFVLYETRAGPMGLPRGS